MKLHYSALIFIFSLTHFSQAQNRLKGTYDSQSKKFKVEGKNYEITHFRHGLSYYYVGDLYGVIDTTGLIICESASDFGNNYNGDSLYASVQLNGKYGKVGINVGD
jgi:hypothetical protein